MSVYDNGERNQLNIQQEAKISKLSTEIQKLRHKNATLKDNYINRDIEYQTLQQEHEKTVNYNLKFQKEIERLQQVISHKNAEIEKQQQISSNIQKQLNDMEVYNREMQKKINKSRSLSLESLELESPRRKRRSRNIYRYDSDSVII